MRGSRLVTALLFVAFFLPGRILAADFSQGLPQGSRLLAVISFAGNSRHLSDSQKRKLDAMQAELAKLDKETLIRIEGHARSGSSEKVYIERSFKLAREVERYLRLECNVSRDLYVGALGDKIYPRSLQFARVVAYPNRFREQWGITEKVSGSK